MSSSIISDSLEVDLDELYDDEDDEDGGEYDQMIIRLMRIADDYGYEFDHLMGAYLGGCLDSYFPMGLPDGDDYMGAEYDFDLNEEND